MIPSANFLRAMRHFVFGLNSRRLPLNRTGAWTGCTPAHDESSELNTRVCASRLPRG